MSLQTPHVLSVDLLTSYLRALMEEDAILSDVWVRGEVTNFSRSAAGHCYFSLSSEGSQLRCVLFRGSQRGLLALPRNGDVVLAHGRVSVYEASGQYQLYVDNIAPEGTGLLQLQFEELRHRLESEGLFAQDRKRPLPERPRAIGVVTSATGAVWHDIQTVTRRRYPLVKLVFAPSAVQGTSAPRELIAGLQTLQDHPDVDVIIIGRGGGSAEDLACFNDEALARAIYASSVPVVSAVGHETDVSIADLVADVRAATPSAAAELCVPDQRELMLAIRHETSRAQDNALWKLQRSQQQFDETRTLLRRISPRASIADHRMELQRTEQHVRALLTARIARNRVEVAGQARSARLLDPRDVLRRGYALVSTNGDSPTRIRTAADAIQAENVRLTFADGTVDATVRKAQT